MQVDGWLGGGCCNGWVVCISWCRIGVAIDDECLALLGEDACALKLIELVWCVK